MPRILVGAYFQETNDFHPNDTVYEDFNIVSGEALLKTTGDVMAGAVQALSQRDDVEIIPTYSATMGAGGTITHECFSRISSELLNALEKNKTGVDGVYLNMHGAMAAEVDKDPEHGRPRCAHRGFF